MLNASFLSLSLLCSLLTWLLCPFSLLSFQFLSPYHLSKGKDGLFSLPFSYQTVTWGFSVSECPPERALFPNTGLFFTPVAHFLYYITFLLIFTPYLPSLFSSALSFFLPFFLFSPLVLQSLSDSGLHGVAPSWRHHPTVNEWVCHTANNLHSSCLICLGLHGSSHDTRAQGMCLSPWRGGSRSTAQGNSVQAQGLFGELVLDLSIRLWRRGTGGLTYPWSRITFFLYLFFLFVQGWFADHACSFPAMPGFGFTQLQLTY